MEKVVTIILNGEELDIARLHQVLEKTTVIIAADGGANYCRKHGIVPDYLIGDFDSVQKPDEVFPAQTRVLHRSDQYSTDLEKALTLAETLNPDRLCIVNANGKRSDHALANLLILAFKSQQFPVEVIDNFGKMRFLLPGEHVFQLPVGTTVSLAAFGPVKNLSLVGFQYPLKEKSFSPYFVGISNVTTSPTCQIRFEQGLLIMYEVERFE